MLIALVGAGAQLLRLPLLGQQGRQLLSGISITLVGAGAQLLHLPLPGEQPRQALGGLPVALIGESAQLFDLAAFDQEVDQPQDSVPSTAVDQRAQVVEMRSSGEMVLEEKMAELPGGSCLAKDAAAVSVFQKAPQPPGEPVTGG